MMRDTKRLIDKNYVMALREKESELQALEAQINPHFLYNVLDSLYWQAMEEDNEKVAEDDGSGMSQEEIDRVLYSQDTYVDIYLGSQQGAAFGAGDGDDRSGHR